MKTRTTLSFLIFSTTASKSWSFSFSPLPGRIRNPVRVESRPKCTDDHPAKRRPCWRHPHRRPQSYDEYNAYADGILPAEKDEYGPLDFAITDSTQLPDELRPSFFEAISNPRDLLALALLSVGTLLSYENVVGNYGETYVLLQKTCVLLGLTSFGAAMLQLGSGYMVSGRSRRGVIDDAVMNAYAGLYSLSVTWLATRASTFCPGWVQEGDGIFPWLASVVFAFSLWAPIVTLLENSQEEEERSWSAAMTQVVRQATGGNASNNPQQVPTELSETEFFRTQGLLAIGVLGCIFVPDCVSFALGQSAWWDRVTASHPSQQILESSTALFALLATEASMVATRCANKGVAEYRVMVPAFAVVCFLLAIVPCVGSLYWLGDDISFFSFYRE